MNIQWTLKNIMDRKGGEKSKQRAVNRAKKNSLSLTPLDKKGLSHGVND